MIPIPIRITNEGGEADNHRLRLADAGAMYSGLNRSISYCLLSFEAGELIERVTRVSSVQIYQRKTEDNCLTHDLIVELSNNYVAHTASFISGVAATYLCKMVDFCFKAAIGKLSDDEYERGVQRFPRIEPYIDTLVEKIEPHLLAVHEPIQDSETISIEMGDDTIDLDQETKDYLAGSNESKLQKFTGNVTRLNIVSGNGRFYARELGYIVAFSQAPALRGKMGSRRLSWSLREKDKDASGLIEISARKIETTSGRLKRLLVEKVVRVKDDEDAADL